MAAYLEHLGTRLSTPSVKQQLSGIRHWLDWLTRRGVLDVNPAASVRGPRYVVHEGKTPVLERSEARALFATFEGKTDVLSLRDQALIAMMLYGFVRVGAVVKMRVRDFADEPSGAWLTLREMGGKDSRLPAHHLVSDFVRAYATLAVLDPDSKAPLFQTAPRRSAALSGKPMARKDVWDMVKRRCAAAGLSSKITNHSFRATGITIHQENGGRIEDAAQLAGHASTRTTQLYNRKDRKLARAEVERVQL